MKADWPLDHKLTSSGLFVPTPVALEYERVKEAEARLKADAEFTENAEYERRLAAITQKTRDPLVPAWRWETSRRPKHPHTLYTADALWHAQKLSETLGSKDSKTRKRDEEILNLLAKIGGDRYLGVPTSNWRAELDQLAAEHPNFRQVVDYLAREFSLSEAAGVAPHLAPILLDGPPSIGKTMFSEKLATILQTGYRQFHFESAQTASALTGTDVHWANSQVGELFTLLADGEFSNPVCLIDEIDKARGDGCYSPTKALYGLLEPHTARMWHDLAMPTLPLDVSHVVWILTSNDKSLVSPPLLSRMRVFDIPVLTVEQSRATAIRIFAQVVAEVRNLEFDPVLPVTMAAVLATTTPREMRRVARDLMAIAVSKSRRHVIQADLEALKFDDATLAIWSLVAQQSQDIEAEIPSTDKKMVH